MRILPHRRHHIINPRVYGRTVYLFLKPPLRHIPQRLIIGISNRPRGRRVSLRVLDFRRINGHIPVIIGHRLILENHLCLQDHMKLHPEIRRAKLL